MSKQLQVVVGLGKTGLSLVRYLTHLGLPVAAVDTRENPPEREVLGREFFSLEVYYGTLNQTLLNRAHTLYVSPGLAVSTPEIQVALENGARLSGDVDLFLQHASAPVIAITGSNAKSTVTTLVAEMFRAAGLNVAVGGNIGTPVLDLLDDAVDCYVLELSSFQLETTSHLQAAAAVCLNISADHMDRYQNLAQYSGVKLGIYHNAGVAVINRDDVSAQPAGFSGPTISFGLDAPQPGQYGLLEREGQLYLARGEEALLAVGDLKIRGRHNYSNALAALALGEAFALPGTAMLEALQAFAGLEHRCQWIADKADVHWYNDSKATNVGATLAALEGLAAPSGKQILIAGGDGKGADFSGLLPAVSAHCRAVVLLGQDAERLADALRDAPVVIERVDSMQDAVARAALLAQPGDSVILAPACASLDMFANFEQRGEIFVKAVEGLPC